MSKYEIDLLGAVWRKASFSNGNGGNCVEVTNLHDRYWALRDSKDPAGMVLIFTPEQWRAFIGGVCAGEFG